jgi:hypothetical protein
MPFLFIVMNDRRMTPKSARKFYKKKLELRKKKKNKIKFGGSWKKEKNKY